MPIFTASELSAQITAWQAALLALSTHQEYWMGTRRIKRSDLPEVRKTLEWLQFEQDKLTAESGSRRVYTTPVGDSW